MSKGRPNRAFTGIWLFLILTAVQAAAQSTAGLAGRVTDGASAPVAGATVTIVSNMMLNGRSTVTDDHGRFAFRDVPPGDYIVSAAKAGYARNGYGARYAGVPPAAVAVEPGQRVGDVNVTLTRGAIAAGVIRDVLGQAVPGIDVIALSVDIPTDAHDAEGLGSATTDARGAFRIFGLPAGRYVLAAAVGLNSVRNLRVMTTNQIDAMLTQLTQGGGATSPTSGSTMGNVTARPRAIAPTYFPGTSDPLLASVFELRPGEEKSGFDFGLALTSTFQVAGQLLGVDGLPAAAMQVSLQPDGPVLPLHFNLTEATAQSDRSGHFSFKAVLPGAYRLSVRAGTSGAIPQRPGSAAVTSWADLHVSVMDTDLENLQLALRPCLKLSGRVVFGGAPSGGQSRTDAAGWHVVAVPDTGTSVVASVGMSADSRISVVRTNGTFDLDGLVPGKYRLSVNALAGAWVLESVVVAGHDVLDSGLDVGDQDVTGAMFRVTDTLSRISGRLLDSAGKPALDYVLIAYPRNPGAWYPRSRRIRAVRPTTDGRYQIENLPAGDYLIAVVTDLEWSNANRPSLLSQLEVVSVPLTLGPAEQKAQDFRVGR